MPDNELSINLLKSITYIIFGFLFAISLYENKEASMTVVENFKYKLLNCVILNCIIIVSSIIFPGLEVFIENFLLKSQNFNENVFSPLKNPLVSRGISSAAGGVHSSFLFFSGYITILNDKFNGSINKKEPFKLNIFSQLFIIILASFFIGRTGLILYAYLFIPLFLFAIFWKNKNSFKINFFKTINYKSIFYLMFFLVTILALSLTNTLFSERILLYKDSFQEWTLNAIISPLNDNSIDQYGLKTNLPKLDFFQFLFGLGSFQNLEKDYGLPDPGFIRLFYGLGIIFCPLYYFVLITYIKNSLSICFRLKRYLINIFIFALIIVELKEPIFMINFTGKLLGLIIGFYLAEQSKDNLIKNIEI